MNILSKTLVATIVGILFVTSPVITKASTTATHQAQLNYLAAEIARLQALLAQLQGVTGVTAGTVTTGQVRIIRDGSVEVRGVVPGRVGGSADGWFEYGTTLSMSYSTPKERVTSGRSFTGIIDDVLANRTYYYRAVSETSSGDITEGVTRTFRVAGDWNNDDWRDDDNWADDWRDDEEIPYVETNDADDVTETSAELNGEVDMQDADNGLVFFAYGEDEEAVEEVTDEDEFRDIDEDGDDLQLIQVASNFDNDDNFIALITGLADDTDYYFRLCVEYEDEEDDEERIVCGEVESFETD